MDPRIAPLSKAMDEGSGTAASLMGSPPGGTGGKPSSKIALLLEVATHSGSCDEPRLKKPVINDPIGRSGSVEAKLKRGEILG